MPRIKSHAAFERAKTLMPGGVNSPARAFRRRWRRADLLFARRRGLSVRSRRQSLHRLRRLVGTDDSGARPSASRGGLSEAAAARHEFRRADRGRKRTGQLIIEAVPSIEKVRLVNSGTEATMSAIRLARGFTGREMIVKFAGNYHGHVDSLLVAAGSSAATLGVPNSPGVTAGTAKDTLVLQYNDVPGLKRRFASMDRGSPA